MITGTTLDEAYAVENAFSQSDECEYILRLCEVVRREIPAGDGLHTFRMIHASAEQRFEAMSLMWQGKGPSYGLNHS